MVCFRVTHQQQAALDGYLPNPDPGIGENGHRKDYFGLVAQAWQGARIRKARRSH